jgi:hypothetical protein
MKHIILLLLNGLSIISVTFEVCRLKIRQAHLRITLMSFPPEES